MAYYKDLREHMETLEAKGKLIRVERQMNKDTELMPLVRWQYRGLAEEQRKAFLFENVVDARGKKYDMPVLVASNAASTEIYALGMMCQPNEIMEKFAQAQQHPIEAKLVKQGPAQEVVYAGKNLMERGCLDEIPVPVSTPGFDNAPYLTCANWVSKDPETGIRNVGNYRGQIRSQTRMGINCTWPQHLRQHWEKCRAKGKPLEAAIAIGVTPNICYLSVTKIPYGVDEFAVAGAIAGEPIELVKCKTVDVEVPATSELVIEGVLPTDSLEWEGPFGEHTGYVFGRGQRPYFNVTAITHRKDAIYNVFFSQFPPSESSKMRQTSDNAVVYHMLKYVRGIEGIKDVCFHEESGSYQFLVISMKKAYPVQVWQALKLADAFNPWQGKMIIAVDEDIDARDPDSVIWALCYRMQPHRDILITQGKVASLDPSAAPPGTPLPPGYAEQPTSSMLIDATIKWDYPPIALPAQKYMEHSKKIWEELGLPKLTPKVPWYGRSLGLWSKGDQEAADLAVTGDYYTNGEKIAENRLKLG
jgi:4-hydroxy-3-polyprenylbenzoate decarboxylase